MYKLSLLAAALIVSIGAYSPNAHAFRLTSGGFKTQPLAPQCYFGRAILQYGPPHPMSGQAAHAITAAANDYQTCDMVLQQSLGFQTSSFNHQYTITDPCTLYTSCPVGQALLTAEPSTSDADTRDIELLREEFNIGEFELRLLRLLGRTPVRD